MRRAALIMPALLIIAGCSTAEQPEAAATSSSLSLPATSSAAPTSTMPAGPPKSVRGNIIKQVGEEGGIADENGAPLTTFVVDSITPDPTCTEGYDMPPDNGHFVVMTWRVTTAPELGQDGQSYFSVSPFDFDFIGADGITRDAGTDPVFYCVDSGELLPSGDFAPGSQYAGSVVLDVSDTTGTIVWRPGFVQGGGWEWTF